MLTTNIKYFSEYKRGIGFDLDKHFDSISVSDDNIALDYLIKASAVYSANIEGNPIDLNSYMNSISSGTQFKPKKNFQEIEDLVRAYEFAKDNELCEKNLLIAHEILSKTILIESKRGIYRSDKMGVFDDGGLVYIAVEAENLSQEMERLFQDIDELLSKNLSLEEHFYHASLIHLKFVHIHPFWDGNGRAARLLEKWFLAGAINSHAWKIQSEKYYKEHLASYYSSINLGVNYYVLDYDNCLRFLLLLVKALGNKIEAKR